MSKSTWTGAINSDWADAANWSPVGVPDASSDVTIAIGQAIASASIGTVNSITDSSDLSFESAGTNTVATILDNAGSLNVDDSVGAGGTILNIGGTLTNSRRLVIGNRTLSASDEVTAMALDNTGSIALFGSGADQALLDVTAGAGFGTAGVLSGDVRLVGDSAIEFAGGEITNLAANAQLHLNGNDAFIEDGTALGSNSALKGLASIGHGAYFGLHNKAAVSTTGSLVNDGHIHLDVDGGDGGSSLTLTGALTNSGSLSIGNTTLSAPDKVTAASLTNTGSIRLTGAGANQALLDVTGGAGFGAAGVFSGTVGLAGDSAIEFASGQIASLAANSQLHLNGNDAFIEDRSAPGSNSALSGLATIGAGATLDLENGASVTTDALANGGTIDLDTNPGDGGSSLTLAGALTNAGFLDMGASSFASPSKVSATALSNTGSINLAESSATYMALLDVTGSAGFGTAGTLTGSVALIQNSAIEFATGQINTLAAGAQLYLRGNNAFIEDSTALGSNSALRGLATIGAGATFQLEDAASVTTGALVNNGNVYVDTNGFFGGSSLTVAGALTNAGLLDMGISSLASPSKVSATALSNTGSINLVGSSATNMALLDVTGSAGFGTAGTLTGLVALNQNSAIEFATGQINTLAAGAQLYLSGTAFVEDSTTLGSNSALAGLSDIQGAIFLDEGASVSTIGALTNAGQIGFINGGGALSIAGPLTNTGALDIGAGGAVTAKSFVNTGTVDLQVRGALDVSGAMTNDGAISIANDTETFAGAVGGAGSFGLSNAHLQFDSAVSSGQTITETGADALMLKQAQSFAATISGFGTGDTIDAANFLAPPATTFNFVENSGGTGGTLTLTDKGLSLTANILMNGHYTNSDFTLAPDRGTGTLVKFA
jgi:hypothetical protein